MSVNKNLDEKVICKNDSGPVESETESSVELEPLVKNDEAPDQENDMLEYESAEELNSEEDEPEEELVRGSNVNREEQSGARQRSTRNVLPVRYRS